MTELERLTKRLFSDNEVRKRVNLMEFEQDDDNLKCASICAAIDVVETIKMLKGEPFKFCNHYLDGYNEATGINDL